MALDLTKAAVAAGVGVADELIERQGFAAGGLAGEEWFRIVAVLGGHLTGMMMPKWANLGETVATAATPLLVKTVARKIMEGGGAAKEGFRPRDVMAGAAARAWVPTAGAGGSYRPFQG